jgi:hypothetical protein
MLNRIPRWCAVGIWLGSLTGLHGAVPVLSDGSGNLAAIGSGGLPNSPPVLESVAVSPGTQFSLSARGHAPGGRWLLNGLDLAGATNPTLLIDSFTGTNDGTYQFLVFDGADWVTNREVRLGLDADRDGLGDAWENTWFGSVTAQNGELDRDGDGTANVLEFEDGTNPTDRNLLLPRLTVYPVGGTVLRSPDQPFYRSNDLVTLNPVPDPGLAFIGWAGDVTGASNPATLRMIGNKVVQANFGLPLSMALNLNATNPVITGGSGGWLGQASVTHDGQGAARVAPPLVGSGDPFLEATVTMPREGIASFWWRIDSHPSSTLTLAGDGTYAFSSQRTLSGVTGWRPMTVYLSAGTHRLRWIYQRYNGGIQAQNGVPLPADTAYVDELVLAGYDDPLVDTDGNGLPDLWEYRYFGRLGNVSGDDPDGDGVLTRVELADGTDPNTKSSVRPRISYVIEGDGTVVASPATEVYTYGQSVTNTASPAPGWQFVAWVGPFNTDYFIPSVVTNNPSTDRLYQAKTFEAIFGLPPGDAVESLDLSWRTGGNVPWYGQMLVSHDGTNAAQSVPLLKTYTEAWLETTVSGPGSLSFWWNVSSATNVDYLTLLVNSNELTGRISGSVDWQPVVLYLPAGLQTLRWLFRRQYGYDTNALNIASLDTVRFTPGATQPEFLELPTALLGFPSSNLVFRVTARGTPTIAYQVRRNGVALTPATTNNLLTISNATAALSGNWIVRAGNGVGFTDSAPIPVTVLPVPPNDNVASATVLAGASPILTGYTFGATVEAGEPSHDGYHAAASVWHRWTAPVSGVVRAVVTATNATRGLTLAVHWGATLGQLTELAGDTGYGGMTNGVLVAQAQTEWRATAGVDYFLAVDTHGVGVFYQLVLEGIPAPVNDLFVNRLPLTGPFARVTDDNSTATTEPGEPPVFSFPPFITIAASNTLWWTWTPPASGPVVLQRGVGAFSPMLSVFTGSALNSLALVTNSYSGGSQLTFNVTRGVPYAISVGADDSGAGIFSFILTLLAPSLSVAHAPGSDGLTLDLQGPPNTSVVVEFSPNLRDWYTWSTNQVGYDGIVRLPDLSVTNRSRTFFRAIAP